MKIKREFVSSLLSIYIVVNINFTFSSLWRFYKMDIDQVYFWQNIKFFSPLDILAIIINPLVIFVAPIFFVYFLAYNIFIFIIQRNNYSLLMQHTAVGMAMGLVAGLPIALYPGISIFGAFWSIFYCGLTASIFWCLQQISFPQKWHITRRSKPQPSAAGDAASGAP